MILVCYYVNSDLVTSRCDPFTSNPLIFDNRLNNPAVCPLAKPKPLDNTLDEKT